MAKYKHDEVVRAWLDGKSIEQFSNGKWALIHTPVESASLLPAFHRNIQYRVKPKTETRKYRVALMDYGPITVAPRNYEQFSGYGHFMRWLTDELSYEREVPN